MVSRPLALFGMIIPALLGPASLASAGPARSAPPQPTVAQPDPLKAAFEALPEPERRAMQTDLIWTADFAGAVTGGYGPRTHDALALFVRRAGLAPAAALDPPARARLRADADAARRAVGFAVVRDPRTGVAVGVPARLAPVRSAVPDGTRYAAADGAFSVELTARPNAGPEGLADALARLTRDAPGRRITYQLSKPDFAVVTGEQGESAFYARLALAPSAPPGERPALRAFTLTHPKADRSQAVVLAVAASFDPFPPPAAPAAAPPLPAPPPPLVGQAVLVAPGLALTRLDRAGCAAPEVGGAPAGWTRDDPITGLALLSLPGHAEASPVSLAAGAGPPRLALFFAPGEAAPVLTAAAAAPESDGVRAPLQGAAAGALLLDGDGALAGLAAARPGRTVAVEGTVAEARYTMAGPAALSAFLGGAGVATRPPGGALAPGEAAARWRPLVLPMRCRS